MSMSQAVDDDAMSWGSYVDFWGSKSVPPSSSPKGWPSFRIHVEDNPTEWTVTWGLGPHTFSIDDDMMVFDVRDPAFKPYDPDLKSVPELSFDREPTPESDIDFDSISFNAESKALLDPSRRPKMDIERESGSKASSSDWFSVGFGFLPGVSVMDRGRPVRKSSAACWPGVGRTHPSEPLEEWRPRKEY
jgi:hypothetical protein